MASGGGYIAEAQPWLSTAEKLLVARDFHGARTFAIRARESYPRLEGPNLILAVADTLIAGESLIVTPHGNHHHDWYAILQVPRFCPSIDLIATQYRKLALLLNPERNGLPFSDHSFKFVSDAWLVLSNPARKMMYDNELQLSQFGERPRQTQMPPPQPPPPFPPQQPARKSPKSREKDGNDRVTVEEAVSNLNRVSASTTTQTRPTQAESTRTNQKEQTRPNQKDSTRPSSQSESSRPNRTESARRSETDSETGSFWTACPYCYVLYEYQKAYEECVLRCQNCKRAFHAVAIPSPQVSGSAKDSYFCCWGFYPLGYSGNSKDAAKWTPVSPMFPCPGPEGGGRGGKSKQNNNASKRAPVIYKEVLISDSESDPSEESDVEWQGEKRKKKAKNVKAKGSESRKNVRKPQAERVKKGNQNQVQNQSVGENGGEGNVGTSSGGSRVLRSSGRKQMGNGLDLNVEFNNEPEDPVAQGIRQEHGEEDNIDGVGFFEGLDEFLSSLPILNVVRDDKVKPT